MSIPSKWATVDIAYGDGKKHLHSPDKESLCFHATEADARSEVKISLGCGTRMVALLKVEGLYKAKSIKVEEVL